MLNEGGQAWAALIVGLDCWVLFCWNGRCVRFAAADAIVDNDCWRGVSSAVCALAVLILDDGCCHGLIDG